MSLLLLLLACGGGSKAELTEGPGTTDPSTGPVFTIEDALLEVDGGTFLGVGTQPVPGVAQAMAEVELNGASVDVTGGAFAHETALEMGINPIDVTGTDIEGGAHRDFGAVLSGDYAVSDGPVYDAIQAHLSEAALADMSGVAGAFIDPDFLNPQLQALNPLVDSPDAVVNLGNVRFDEPTISLVPGPNGLQMELILPNFVLPVDATIPDALPFGIDLDLSADVEADAIVLYATIDLSTDGNGHLEVEVKNTTAELQGFDLDTGLLEIVDWLVIDDDDIADLLEDQVAALGPSLGDMIGGLLRDLDLKTELDLFGSPLVLWPAFDDASVDSDGVYLSLAVAIDVEGAQADAPGHLFFPAPASRVGNSTLVQISDGLMNRALFEVWASGALDLELPLDTPETGILLTLFGGGDEGTLSLDMGLPPVWLEKGGQSRLQLGDTILTVATPGGEYGEEVSFQMFFDAAAAIEVTADGAGITLSDPNVILVPTGEGADSEEMLELADALEAGFGLALGILNGMLSFPLDGLLGEGVTLPELALERDPSGTGVAMDLDLAQIDIAALLLGPQPPESVIVSPSAVVYDDDMLLTDDNVEGWLCENNDVEATGNDGVWYVEDGTELILTGTGHEVWVMDGARVVLEAGGNEVWAHTGSSVADNDGSNTVTWLDPLTLDLSTAPKPGCN